MAWELCRLSDGKYSVRADGEELAVWPFWSHGTHVGTTNLPDIDLVTAAQVEELLNRVAVQALE